MLLITDMPRRQFISKRQEFFEQNIFGDGAHTSGNEEVLSHEDISNISPGSMFYLYLISLQC